MLDVQVHQRYPRRASISAGLGASSAVSNVDLKFGVQRDAPCGQGYALRICGSARLPRSSASTGRCQDEFALAHAMLANAAG
jgi:hypothetical protein